MIIQTVSSHENAVRTLNHPRQGRRTLGMNTDHAAAPDGRLGLALRFAGAALLAATAAIHLDLYLTGYNTIPTIRWLFLFQVIAAFLLAAAVALTGSRLLAAAGAGFAIATLGGYLLSLWVGLFGFREVRTTAGIVAGIIEVAAFAALAALAVLPQAAPATASPFRRIDGAFGTVTSRLPGGSRGVGAGLGAVSVAALIVLAASVASAGGTTTPVASGGSSVLRSTTIGGVTVLTNAKGFTLYWFVPDSPTKSVCNGGCASYWPPVKGPATVAAGIPGTLTTITRADGTKQAAYDGHPLYSYIGDSKPGQANGNNVTLNGGRWHEVAVSK
jgi:predicted lipoprotein with Yx(FWY)xxD motif